MDNTMKIDYTLENNKLTLFVKGRIDTSNAPEAERQILEIIEKSGTADMCMDMSELEYISSSGLRILIKLRKKAGKVISLLNVAPQIYEILETTGFTEMFDVTKMKREISVDGCEIIGKGFYGTVYRIDDETVVKVYDSPDSLAMIQNEKKLATTALVAGVPTAIAYDIVRVGKSYGSVFELLNAKTLNDILKEDLSKVDDITRQYAEFFKLVNSQEVAEGKLRSAKQQFLGYLDKAEKYLPPEIYEQLKKLLEAVPEQHGIVHGDAQMKNIMVVNGEPMLIDMDTLCEGNAIFDLQSVYVTYFAYGEDYPQNFMEFLGIPPEVSHQIWENFIGYYFETDDTGKIAMLRDKISIVGCIRFLFLLDLSPDYQQDLFNTRINRTVERLKELAFKYDSLTLE